MKRAHKIDVSGYRRLIAKVSPMMIKTEEENERILAVIEKLILKGDARSAEEDAVLELLSHLVEQFESYAYPVGKTTPASLVAFLLEQRALRPAALEEVLGSRGRASDILSGKRSVSKRQAIRLGEFFHISPAAFL